MTKTILLAATCGLVLMGSAQAGPELFNKNTTTNQKVAAYNQGYATAAVDDVCHHHTGPFLKVLDEAVRQGISNDYINNPKLEAHWQRGHDDAYAQGMAALDREDGLAIDAICSKAQKLPLMKGLFKWLDDAPFRGYAEICRKDPIYYMCPHSRRMIEQIKRDLR